MNVTVQAKPTGLQRVGDVSGTFGYTHGLHQPAVMLKLKVGPPPAEKIVEQIDQLVRQKFGLDDSPKNMDPQIDAQIAQILSWSQAILKKHNQPIFEDARAFQDPADTTDIWTIVHPCLYFQASLGAMDLSMSLLRLADTHAAADTPELQSRVKVLAEKFAKVLDSGRAPGFNGFHFLAAAAELGVPWSRLSNTHFQFGYGASSRLLDSSFTDRTPQISTNIARNKMLASNVLRSAAIPVAAHSLAKSADEAVKIAERLGFPVVVKPADQDGGIGVSAYLLDAGAVRRAFEQARTCSKAILVEKHFIGRDYRIHIVDGEVHGILERAPGGVTGDGRHCVRDLVKLQNQERANAIDDRRHLHAIKFDEDAEAMLAHAGMNWSSTPPPGQFVRLRGAANVASGGIPVPVPIEKAHPDNLNLALRTARVLRLDVAGIDLITPDITKSWFETGAIICEVNSQPQMFTTMHKPMLESLLGEAGGRIPIVLVLSPNPTEYVSPKLHELMRTTWPNTGMFNHHGIHIGTKAVSGQTLELFHGVQALIKDPAVDALIVAAHPDTLPNGWPFDRVDTLVLVGEDETGDADTAKKNVLRMVKFANWLKPSHVLIDGDASSFIATQNQFKTNRTPEVIGAGCNPAETSDMLANAAFSSVAHQQDAPAADTEQKRRAAKPSQKA